jgi:hypothetical protein
MTPFDILPVAPANKPIPPAPSGELVWYLHRCRPDAVANRASR